MKPRNLTTLVTLLIVLPFLLAACGDQETVSAPDVEPIDQTEQPSAPVFSGDVDEIIFYNRPEYIDPDIYAMFQEELGIEVTEDNFSSNEDLLAKLMGLGNVESYALIAPKNPSARKSWTLSWKNTVSI